MGATTDLLLTGSCACRAITYTSSTLPTSSTNCHCRTCRKISGAAFVTFIDLPAAAVTWLAPPSEVSLSDEATRGFCGRCGGTLFMRYKHEKDTLGIALGSVDDDKLGEEVLQRLRPTKHIFVDERARWLDVPDDGLERCNKFPKGFEEEMKQARS